MLRQSQLVVHRLIGWHHLLIIEKDKRLKLDFNFLPSLFKSHFLIKIKSFSSFSFPFFNNQLTMSQTTTTSNSKAFTASKMEENLYIRLENSKDYFTKANNVLLPYWNAILRVFNVFWQYQEFRLGVYIFGLLSMIPSALFLLFLAVVVFSTTIFVGLAWTFFVFSALTVGLMFLVPILIGCSIIVGGLIAGYDVYQYLVRLKQANKQQNNATK